MSQLPPKSPHGKEREKLPAEEKFDTAVYGGISYAGQALTGSGLTYWIKHAGGRPLYDKMANWAGPNFISKITRAKGAEAIAKADSWITVSTMVVVGTMFLIPVKWLENRKASIIRNWTDKDNEDRKLQGKPISHEDQAMQEKQLRELEAEPKQTWRSLFTGRAASLVAVFTAVPLIGDYNKVMESGFKNVTKSAAKSIGFNKIAKSEIFNNASGIAFYDLFYSMISAGGLYVFSHFISPPKDKHPDHKNTELIAAIVEPELTVAKTLAPDHQINAITQLVSNASDIKNAKGHHQNRSFVESTIASESLNNSRLGI